jgi:hypothetical protein
MIVTLEAPEVKALCKGFHYSGYPGIIAFMEGIWIR